MNAFGQSGLQCQEVFAEILLDFQRNLYKFVVIFRVCLRLPETDQATIISNKNGFCATQDEP